MKYERWVALTDTHGDMMATSAVYAALDFVRAYKPTVRIHLGDNFDFRWLGKHASANEQIDDIGADFYKGCWFFEKFDPTVFLWGNHDKRLLDVIHKKSEHSAIRRQAEEWIKDIDKILVKCKQVKWGKRYGIHRYGNFSFMHGYASGKASAEKMAMAYGNCIAGHLHRNEEVTAARIDRPTCYLTGCLCKLDQDYNLGQIATLAQRHGWSYGIKTKSGKLVVQQAKFVDGKWYTPDNF